MQSEKQEHYCQNIDKFPLDKFLQKGKGKGRNILILGEAPAPNGWRKSGKAFYTQDGKLLPTGRNLNKLLIKHDLSVEICGFTELVKCYPGKNRKLLMLCGEKCWPIFLRQLKENNYTLIIILGVKTLEIFNKILKTDLKIGELAQTRIESRQYNILPIYHPSPIAPFNHLKNTEIFNNLEEKLKEII